MNVIKIGKKEINLFIVKYIPQNKMGRKLKIPLWRIVKMILYRLKTGCQWRYLPVKLFCRKVVITWQSVYYHFLKWAKSDVWQNIWTQLLISNKAKLDLSSIQLDGSHTPAKNGGEAVGYQGRKKAKTTNALFLTDKNGQILAMSPPVAGNQNDLYNIEKMAGKIFNDLQAAELKIDGLFMNADAGFDSQKFRRFCDQNGVIPNFDINKRNSKNADYQPFKDDKLYKNRFVVERTNAWIDSFKSLLIRFEKLTTCWTALHYMAFIFLFLQATF